MIDESSELTEEQRNRLSQMEAHVAEQQRQRDAKIASRTLPETEESTPWGVHEDLKEQARQDSATYPSRVEMEREEERKGRRNRYQNRALDDPDSPQH